VNNNRLTREDDIPAYLKIKMLKTGMVFGGVTIFSSIFAGLFIEHKYFFFSLLLANLSLSYVLHEEGKLRRPGQNIFASCLSFLSPPEIARDIRDENFIRNIINGGAAYFDELIKEFPDEVRKGLPREFRP
jgi:hypothetical protein